VSRELRHRALTSRAERSFPRPAPIRPKFPKIGQRLVKSPDGIRDSGGRSGSSARASTRCGVLSLLRIMGSGASTTCSAPLMRIGSFRIYRGPAVIGIKGSIPLTQVRGYFPGGAGPPPLRPVEFARLRELPSDLAPQPDLLGSATLPESSHGSQHSFAERLVAIFLWRIAPRAASITPLSGRGAGHRVGFVAALIPRICRAT
jgi:hypothetical protein